MAKLIYFMPTSLDGYIAGEGEDLDWSVPDEEVMAFINDLERPIGTHLLGRKNYETMVFWETPEFTADPTPATLDFARIWQAAEKIVYSKSLEAVASPKTRLVREFDPQAIRDLKARLPHDISVSGPNLAGQAIRSGLVDEIHLLVAPATLGHGKRVLPEGVRANLKLLDERRFTSGTVYLRYRQEA